MHLNNLHMHLFM